MSVLSSHAFPRSAGFGSLVQPSRVVSFARAIGVAWQARMAARQVESLSDEMLHDIGITRGEIDQAVRYGRLR